MGDDMAFAGAWLTRRVRLNRDESTEWSAWATRLAFLGSEVPGLLTLTNQRLIWTPVPFNPWGIFPWVLAREAVVRTQTVPRSFWRLWRPAVSIEGGGCERRFYVGGHAKTEDSLKTLTQWRQNGVTQT
jgi:hypothetical protein